MASRVPRAERGGNVGRRCCHRPFARGGLFTVYDGVVGPWFLTTFGSGTGLAELDYVVLMPSVEACVDRVATRIGHGFRDEKAARKMHDEFAGASVSSRHVLTIGSETVGEVVEQITVARAAGELRFAVPAE